jgi:hypothetical protein
MKVYFGPYESEVIPFSRWRREYDVYRNYENKWYDKLIRGFLRIGGFVYPINTINKTRKIKVRIDNYDVWCLDKTLAAIITPALQRLKDKKHYGSPHVDDDDVPEHLKSTNDLPKDHEWDIGHNHHARWDYVIDEMIWAFQQDTFDDEAMFHHNSENIGMDMSGGKVRFFTPEGKAPHYFDREGYKAHCQRKLKGRMLFAKYYEALWD